MVRVDGLFETVLALAGAGLALNIAFAVLVWLYAAVVIGGPPIALLVALAFIAFGTVIVMGFVGLYLPGATPE